MPATVLDNDYVWLETQTYAQLETQTYGVLAGGRLQITRTLASSGAVTSSRARYLAVGGSLGLAGTLPKQATHRFQGTLTTAGALLRSRTIVKILGGISGPTGLLRRGITRRLQGTLTTSGTVATRRSLPRPFGGLLAPTGALTRRLTLRRSWGGNLNSSGVILLGKIYTRSIGGTLASSGTLGRSRQRLIALLGTLAASGTFQYRQLYRYPIGLSGQLWLQGRVSLHRIRGQWPPLGSVGVPHPPIPPLVEVGAGTAPPLLATVRAVPPMAGVRAGGTLRPLTPRQRPPIPPLREG